MSRYQLTGLGNAIVDILVKISEEEFARYNVEKGSMNLVDEARQKELLSGLGGKALSLMSGGSNANATILFSQLGGTASLITCVADDRYGLHYLSEFEALKIGFPVLPVVGGHSGTSLILVTPDAERSMQTHLGVSAGINAEHIDESVIKESEWVFIEGYLLSNEAGQGAVSRTIELAKKHGTRIAFTLSAAFIVEFFREQVEKVIPDCDLVFANKEEALLFSGASNVEDAAVAISRLCPHNVITLSGDGALVQEGGKSLQVNSFACTPVDATGAGDAFAGAYLYGVTHGLSSGDSARRACYLASKVISQIGARLQGNVEGLWNEVELES